jgi:hypothetical protein
MYNDRRATGGIQDRLASDAVLDTAHAWLCAPRTCPGLMSTVRMWSALGPNLVQWLAWVWAGVELRGCGAPAGMHHRKPAPPSTTSRRIIERKSRTNRHGNKSVRCNDINNFTAIILFKKIDELQKVIQPEVGLGAGLFVISFGMYDVKT